VQLIKVAAAVLNQTPLDWDGNLEHIRQAIEQARRQQVSIVCLPELCITGYGCEDAFFSPGVQEMAWDVLCEIVPETQGMIVSVGLPLVYHNALFNAAALLVDGKIAGFVAKRFLAGDGIHYEPRWFKPWPRDHRGVLTRDRQRYPIGDVHFNCGGVRIGFEICEDAWVARRPGSELSARGVDIILNPSASHFAFGKTEVRHRFVLEGSRAFALTYIYSNLLGNEAGRAIYDGDAMIATAGRLVANGPRFSFADTLLTSAVIDVDLTRMQQERLASYVPDLAGAEAACVEVPFTYPDVDPEPSAARLQPWEESPDIKEEEFARAVRLALFDYLRKSYSKGFVVSLSGGADSAACATLVGLMVEAALAELGIEGLRAKLAHIPQLKEASDARGITRQLLSCAYQPTRNSSETTLNAARQVAEEVGAEFLIFDVDAVVQDYHRIISQAIGRPLNWETDDIALQNIQARTRSPSVWMLANLRGALLLSTSNRSEAAVGYATMDGDTSGGLCPIAGIDKNFLRKWLRWLETTGPYGGRPYPKLAAVNCQAPTAELRPQEAGQTDEQDLMPYDVLDAIERLAIRDKLVPLEVLRMLRPIYPNYSVRQLAEWVERFFRLWCRNQWKRERYAPSFHLDDENLDPKTWCRFPILSGGYRREVRQMWDYVERVAVEQAGGPSY
jgi:NAD+ synthase (glutamine-hydrolysing)